MQSLCSMHALLHEHVCIKTHTLTHSVVQSCICMSTLMSALQLLIFVVLCIYIHQHNLISSRHHSHIKVTCMFMACVCGCILERCGRSTEHCLVSLPIHVLPALQQKLLRSRQGNNAELVLHGNFHDRHDAR